ncbi:MAG: hypothetical protein AAGD38_18670 [Acidobacteriota bacterium]
MRHIALRLLLTLLVPVSLLVVGCSQPGPDRTAEDEPRPRMMRLAKDAGALLIENEDVCFEILRSAVTRVPATAPTPTTTWREVQERREEERYVDEVALTNPVHAYLYRDRRTEIVASTTMLEEIEILLDALDDSVPIELLGNLEAMYDIENSLCSKANPNEVMYRRDEITRVLSNAAVDLPKLRRAIRQATNLTVDEQEVIVGRYRDPIREAVTELVRKDPELRSFVVDPFEPALSAEEMAEKREIQEARRAREEDRRRAMREKEAELRRELEKRRRETASRAPERVGLVEPTNDDRKAGESALGRALRQQQAPGPSAEAVALEAERQARRNEVLAWHKGYMESILPFKKSLQRFSLAKDMKGNRRTRACAQAKAETIHTLSNPKIVDSPDPHIKTALTTALSQFRDSASACIEGDEAKMHELFNAGERSLGATAQQLGAYGLQP